MIHWAFTPQCLILGRFEIFGMSSFVGLFPQLASSINFQGRRDLCFHAADASHECTHHTQPVTFLPARLQEQILSAQMRSSLGLLPAPVCGLQFH